MKKLILLLALVASCSTIQRDPNLMVDEDSVDFQTYHPNLSEERRFFTIEFTPRTRGDITCILAKTVTKVDYKKGRAEYGDAQMFCFKK